MFSGDLVTVRPENLNSTIEFLTAMITPALLISATGSLVLSTSTRLGRVVDRVRELERRLSELILTEDRDKVPLYEKRIETVVHLLDKVTSRARILQRAQGAFYYGLGFFVLTSVTIAVAGLFNIYRWLPIPVGVVGILFLLYGSMQMLRETRMATATINAEMDFTWSLAKTVAPKEIISRYTLSDLETIEPEDSAKSEKMTVYEPGYLKLLKSGELLHRVEALEQMLSACNICPKDCGNNRLADEIAACYSGRLPIVSSFTAHFGEEPCLSGSKGAGNIFFGNCNLRCVYCQNYQISQTWKTQKKNEITHERLAEIMLELQSRGCHNIGFVSPTHFVPQMARAIFIAASKGLRIPIVYNTNAYDSVDVLRLLEGVIDIYLPDLKYADSDSGFQFSKVRDYTLFARSAIKEMHRQMGPGLLIDENGLLKRGLLIRLLVLPNEIAGIGESLRWIRDELGPQTAISLMAQYYATNRAQSDPRYILLSRRISTGEWYDAVTMLEELGFEEGFVQEYESASYYYRPDFTDTEKPFKDIRDFQ